MKLIYFEILKAAALIRRQFDVELATGHKLTDVDAYILLAIQKNRRVTQVELAKLTRFDKVTISRSCDELVQLNLATRERHPVDGRKHILSLTSAGESVASHLFARMKSWETMFWHEFGGAPYDQLQSITAHLEGDATKGSYRPITEPNKDAKLGPKGSRSTPLQKSSSRRKPATRADQFPALSESLRISS